MCKLRIVWLSIIILHIGGKVLGQQFPSTVDQLYSEKYCPPLWQDNFYGEQPGLNNNMLVFDVDSDGIDEVIINANISGNPKRGFWYILKYNPQTNTYQQEHISPLFENVISHMAITTSGNQPQLCVSVLDQLYIHDLSTLNITHQINIEEVIGNGVLRTLEYYDFNQDGIEDIILNGYSWIKIYDGYSYDILLDQSGEFNKFSIGNVDDDSNTEIVFSNGGVYDLNSGQSLHLKFTFELMENADSDILLLDIDEDGKQEGIIGLYTDRIQVFDLEAGVVKFDILVPEGIKSMILKDVEGTELPELAIATHSDRVLIYSFETTQITHSFQNYYNKIHSLAISDFDNDGELEMITGSRCGPIGGNCLYAIDLASGTIEYKSKFGEGNFTSIEVEDIDQDGKDEIITINDNYGNYGGTISIYDAESKALKFRSEIGFLPEITSNNTNIEIYDFGQDGDLDIIVASGDGFRAKIWVVDVSTYSIEKEHLYDFPVNSTRLFQKSFLENENQDFLMVESTHLSCINSTNFAMKWRQEIPNSLYGETNIITTHDLYEDGEKDLIVAGKRLSVFDANGNYKFQTIQNTYTVAYSLNFGSANSNQIIAGTSIGQIFILNDDLERIKEYKVSDVAITNIIAADVLGNSENELIIGTENSILIMTEDGTIFKNPIGINNGSFNGFKYVNYNNNAEKVLLVGTAYNVMEMDLSCIECLQNNPEIAAINPTCENENGSIEILNPENYTQLIIDDTDFEGLTDSLASGSYSIQLSDLEGCFYAYEAKIFSEDLRFITNESIETCKDANDGAIYIEIIKGKSGYDYLLFDSLVSDTISGLTAGIYEISVMDSNGCLETKEVILAEPDDLQLDATVIHDNHQTSEPDGSININLENATFLWDDGSTDSTLENLNDGMYSVTVTDQFGCTLDTTFTLSLTSIQHIDDPLEFTIHPNPANSFMNVTFENGMIDELSISSIKGEDFGNQEFTKVEQNKYQIDVSSFPTGLYIVTLKLGIHLLRKKLIIN